MTLNEFIAKWTGKTVDFDGVYPSQCMDLAHQYVLDVLGITDRTVIAAPSAYQVYSNFKWEQYFDRIANTPFNVPQSGDLIVWGQGLGTHGHIAIFVSGNVYKFTSFDSNFPLGSLPRKVEHDYSAVLGWLHPKAQSVNSTEYQSIVKELNTLKTQLAGLQATAEENKRKVSVLETKIEKAKAALQ